LTSVSGIDVSRGQLSNCIVVKLTSVSGIDVSRGQLSHFIVVKLTSMSGIDVSKGQYKVSIMVLETSNSPLQFTHIFKVGELNCESLKSEKTRLVTIKIIFLNS